jgi:tripartite-type tricarboxylate transporter receptor subunit TctC
MSKSYTRTCVAMLLACVAVVTASTVRAEGFPNRPITIVVPVGPGSAADLVPRMLSEKVGARLGQQIIVLNKPGGSTMIANEYVYRAPPDGYTLLCTTTGMVIAANAAKNIAYDTSRFTSITVLVRSPLALAANLSFPPRNFAEFIEYAKANPNKVSFGSLGFTSSHLLTAEKLKLEAGIDMVHIPYNSSSAARVDLLSGRIHIMFDNLASLLPMFQSGKLRPLAVTSPTRVAQLPDVPTLAESGLKDFESLAMFGIAAPPGTPKDVVAKLNSAFVEALATPEIRQRLIDSSFEVIGNSPEAADAYLRQQLTSWGAIVKAANIRLD